MVRRMVVDGEAFALLLNSEAGLSLRLIDSEQVDASRRQPVRQRAGHCRADGGGVVVIGADL